MQAQVINLLEELQDEFGLTYLVIAHDLAVVRHISDRIGVMYLGGMVEEADAGELYAQPAAPLHAGADVGRARARPGASRTRREQILLTGDLPSPSNPPTGCRFHTRCPWRQPTRCDDERPQLRVVEVPGVTDGHRVACHWAEGIAPGEITPHEVAPELAEQSEVGTPAEDDSSFDPDLYRIDRPAVGLRTGGGAQPDPPLVLSAAASPGAGLGGAVAAAS